MAGRHARGHAHRDRRTPVVVPIRRTAADKSEIVLGLQRALRGWVVMWSAWRQEYTGFACFTAEPLIIDESDSHRFLYRIRQVERAYRRQTAAIGVFGLPPPVRRLPARSR